MAFVKTIVIVFQFLIFSIFYFRRWIYDHVNTGIIGLYVHVHSNGTRTFPRDVKVPSMYYVATFLGIFDPPPTLCKQNVVSMQNKPFFYPLLPTSNHFRVVVFMIGTNFIFTKCFLDIFNVDLVQCTDLNFGTQNNGRMK